MTFNWRAAARKDLRRIGRTDAVNILHSLTRYGANRQGDVVRLVEKEFQGVLRLRCGDWRVFFKHEPDGSVTVLRVLHRSEAY